MILKFWKYSIEEDRFGYIFRINEIIKEGKNKGEIRNDDSLYPSTLRKAFELLIHKYKKDNKKCLEIQEYIEEIDKMNKKFLKDLKMLLKDNDLNERTDNPTSWSE